MFHTTSAPLGVVAVFILQGEAQEHDRERYHETWPFFFGLKGLLELSRGASSQLP